MLVELGVDAYHSLFECHFFLWVEIFCVFLPTGRNPYHGKSEFGNLQSALLKIISQVNAEVTDQSLRTCVYHAFLLLERTIGLGTSVYKGISLSPSDNLICRDQKGCGIDAPFDKEHLLAVIPWSTHDYSQSLSVFQGSQYIQSECIATTITHPGQHPNRSVLFDVDTGRIAELTSASMLCFPDVQSLPSLRCDYKEMDASVQIIRLVPWQFLGEFRSPYLTGTQYKVTKRHDSLDNNQGHYTNSMFISIINTQTLHCNNYRVHGWQHHCCSVV
ncbi:hypothetical protein ARMSODRAFT_372155 [Armillaria solidipes]|uniref:Uncharacterized protein n=1 Tax=Armillaria solidipes TaxID=1076256 RepID=A0A2H3BBA2_9AGAR|nr:hypothetical protein ARMSODRAFT_372155 [Armillaria solidipes]